MRTYQITMVNGEKIRIPGDPSTTIEARLASTSPFMETRDLDGRRVFINTAHIASVIERDSGAAAGKDANDSGPIEAIIQAVTPLLDR